MVKRQIAVTINTEIINRIDSLVQKGTYASRSHAIRVLTKRGLECKV